jgi:PleD family two-component response regulator
MDSFIYRIFQFREGRFGSASLKGRNQSNIKRIMLVEDEDDILMLFKMILESDGRLKVESFHDPFSALNNFRPGRYDLMMIDIVLPKMNGFELYHKEPRLYHKESQSMFFNCGRNVL